MKFMKLMKFTLVALLQYLLVGCVLLEKNIVPTNCNITVHDNYKSILASNTGKIPSLPPYSPTYEGYSLLPLGSKESAIIDAKIKACKSGYNEFYISYDQKKTLQANQLPKGYFMGGVYQIYALKPVKAFSENEKIILEQMKIWFLTPANNVLRGEHLKHLIKKSKNKNYKKVAITIEEIIKKQGANAFYSSIYNKLLESYVYHKGVSSKAKLLSWAKFHENKYIRLSALTSLVDGGYARDVEGVIGSETDQYVIRTIKKKLI
jgi:hypothetical protein